MPSIVTSKFRLLNAINFRQSIESGTDKYYLSIGRQMPWENESIPPTPIDNSLKDPEMWGESIAAKRITFEDTALGVPKIEWTYGATYNRFTNENNDNFYVVTDEFKVYKCLDRRPGDTSKHKPTSTAIEPFTNIEDSYKWKYLYTISTADALKFATHSFIPVKTQSNNYTTGSVYAISIISGGSGYSTASLPTVTIVGNGNNTLSPITAEITADCIEGGVIKYIRVLQTGTNHTSAVITITSTVGSGAKAEAIMSPPGGHGASVEYELDAHTVCLTCRLTESLTNFPSINDYRRLMLINNPVIYGTAAIASDSTYDTTYKIIITHQSGSPVLPADASAVGVTSGCKINFISATSYGINQYRVTYTRDISENFNHPQIGEELQIADGGRWLVNKTYLNGAPGDKLPPGLTHNSGNIIFIEQRRPIMRAPEQTENIILWIEF